ncbi:hypothetical protein [Paenibacillus beijingensis]|nr:hypothetical protein [Paenibacillus beijingensis]
MAKKGALCAAGLILTYGQPYRMRIFSKRGFGTIVQIKIPLQSLG